MLFLVTVGPNGKGGEPRRNALHWAPLLLEPTPHVDSPTCGHVWEALGGLSIHRYAQSMEIEPVDKEGPLDLLSFAGTTMGECSKASSQVPAADLVSGIFSQPAED